MIEVVEGCLSHPHVNPSFRLILTNLHVPEDISRKLFLTHGITDSDSLKAFFGDPMDNSNLDQFPELPRLLLLYLIRYFSKLPAKPEEHFNLCKWKKHQRDISWKGFPGIIPGHKGIVPMSMIEWMEYNWKLEGYKWKHLVMELKTIVGEEGPLRQGDPGWKERCRKCDTLSIYFFSNLGPLKEH